MSKQLIEIPLTNGLISVIDQSDFSLVSQYKWFASSSGKSGLIYARAVINKRATYLHRFLMNETDRYVFIDHIDGDTLNNSKSNLRKCTPAQNQMNKRLRKNVAKRFIGVQKQLYPGSNRWSVTVWASGKPKYIGSFKSEIDAALAYNEAAKIEKGEFAKLNNIPSF